MWGTALPDFTLGTIKALPRWFHRLATSHIRQIEVLYPGSVNVQVKSSSGLYYYLVEKHEKSGRWDWRVVKEGILPQGGVVIKNGVAVSTELRVDGGFALFGGRISSEPPTDWLPPLTQHKVASSGEGSLPRTEFSASGSNQVRLSLEPQRVPWQDPPAYREPWHKVVAETPFSASLSNAAGLNLRP